MDQNPYSALPSGSGGGFDDATPFSIDAALTESWEVFKANAAPLVLVSLAYFVVAMVISFASGMLQALIGGVLGVALAKLIDPDTGPMIGSLSVQFTLMPVNQVLMAAVMWIVPAASIAAVRGEPVTVETLTGKFGRVVPFILAQLLLFVASMVGFSLCIVPGVLVGLGGAFTMFFAIDTELGAIDSFKASWEATEGNRMTLFLLYLVVALGMMMVGLFTCGLGLLAGMPYAFVVGAWSYERLRKHSAVA